MPRTEYFEIVAKSALNRVQHMGFKWSLNPYQAIEGTYRLTRRCLEALRDFKTPIGLITKGTMVIRDIDVLAELSRRAKTTVCLSIPTVDETVWAKTEPGTPPPHKRLKVLRALVDAGIEAGVGMAPVLPGLSDSPNQLEATVAAAASAGACFVWANIIYLKPGTKEHFMEFLGRDYPHLLARYHDLFPGAYAPAAVKAPVIGAVGALKRRYEIGDRRAWRAEPPSEPVQLGLAV